MTSMDAIRDRAGTTSARGTTDARTVAAAKADGMDAAAVSAAMLIRESASLSWTRSVVRHPYNVSVVAKNIPLHYPVHAVFYCIQGAGLAFVDAAPGLFWDA